VIVPQESLDHLASVGDRAEQLLGASELADIMGRAIRSLPPASESVDLDLPVKQLAPFGSEVEARHGTSARSALAAAIVSHLAVRLSDRLATMGLPDGVLEQYPAWYRRLVDQLNTSDLSSYWIGSDSFLKDVRVSGGYSVPCGAQDVDLASMVSRRSVVRSILTRGDLRSGSRVLRLGTQPWFRIHTDPRHLEEFDEPGWERCYMRIADLLHRHPTVKGMVGTSWFYDPQLVGISPRLAYLQRTPIAAGALMVNHGPGAIHTERATATSPTRRALVEQGSYLPNSYSVVWPRRQLLQWAAQQPGVDDRRP
jgi:hypothetical protein